MPVARPAVERFWEKVDASSGDCWIWTASKHPKGYGQFHLRRDEARRVVMVRAHRFAYEDAVGPIPEGMELDHLCRNRACVNPMHLEPVTTRENQHRSPLTFAGRSHGRTHCLHGHEYTPETTRWKNNGRKRECKTCHNERRRVAK